MTSPAKDDAQTKASIDQKFQKLVEGIQTEGRNQYQSAMGEAQRKWDVPEDLKDKDILEIEGMTSPAFDRDDLNSKYKECIQDPAAAGTVADVIAIKKQIDYIAQEERAYRFEHASLVRCMAHGAARGIVAADSITQPAVLREIESLIKTGGAN